MEIKGGKAERAMIQFMTMWLLVLFVQTDPLYGQCDQNVTQQMIVNDWQYERMSLYPYRNTQDAADGCDVFEFAVGLRMSARWCAVVVWSCVNDCVRTQGSIDQALDIWI